MRASRIFSFTLLLILASLSGCGPSEKQRAEERSKAAAANALKSLRKIEAATQVGVNRMQYGPLLIEAKATLNEANAFMIDGDIKRDLNAAMEAFTDASGVWQQEYGVIQANAEPGLTWQKKYNVPSRESTVLGYPVIDRETTVQLAWKQASQHLDRASAQLNTKP